MPEVFFDVCLFVYWHKTPINKQTSTGLLVREVIVIAADSLEGWER